VDSKNRCHIFDVNFVNELAAVKTLRFVYIDGGVACEENRIGMFAC